MERGDTLHRVSFDGDRPVLQEGTVVRCGLIQAIVEYNETFGDTACTGRDTLQRAAYEAGRLAWRPTAREAVAYAVEWLRKEAACRERDLARARKLLAMTEQFAADLSVIDP